MAFFEGVMDERFSKNGENTLRRVKRAVNLVAAMYFQSFRRAWVLEGESLAARLRDFLSEHTNNRRGPPKHLARTSPSRPTRYVISANTYAIFSGPI